MTDLELLEHMEEGESILSSVPCGPARSTQPASQPKRGQLSSPLSARASSRRLALVRFPRARDETDLYVGPGAGYELVAFADEGGVMVPFMFNLGQVSSGVSSLACRQGGSRPARKASRAKSDSNDQQQLCRG